MITQSKFTFIATLFAVKLETPTSVSYFHDEDQTKLKSVAWLFKDEEGLANALELTLEGKVVIASRDNSPVNEDLFIWLTGIAAIHGLSIEEVYIPDEDEAPLVQTKEEHKGVLH